MALSIHNVATRHGIDNRYAPGTILAFGEEQQGQRERRFGVSMSGALSEYRDMHLKEVLFREIEKAPHAGKSGNDLMSTTESSFDCLVVRFMTVTIVVY